MVRATIQGSVTKAVYCNPVMNRILRYFNALADRIAADAEIAGSSTHCPISGPIGSLKSSNNW
jgi:hypothetical protein